MPRLDPDVREVVAPLDEALPPWHEPPIEEARRIEDEAFSGDGTPAVDGVEERTIPGPDGRLRVRIYRPAETPAPAVAYFHGGGWVLGTLDSTDGICRLLCRRAGVAVVSVEYRRAPEHPFPAAVEDARAAVEWVAENPDAVGGDGRLAVGGASAGGNLAAAVTLLSDRPALDAQLLLYPITDAARDRDGGDDYPLLTGADMAWFQEQYLPDDADPADPRASPLRTDDRSGAPPAVVVTAGVDPLCEEGVEYVERLVTDGVDVAHHHYPGGCHGLVSLAGELDLADAAADEAFSSFAAVLEETPGDR